MKQLYHYIRQQSTLVKQRYPSDEPLLSMVVNILSGENCVPSLVGREDVSYSKIVYVLDALRILDRRHLKSILHESDVEDIKRLFRGKLETNFGTVGCVKPAKILSLLQGGIDGYSLDVLLHSLRSYLENEDYLFERNATVIICDIIELLMDLREEFPVHSAEISKLISSYLKIVVSSMKDIDFGKNRHSFFLKEISSAVEALYWEEGDMRKSILLLKEGFCNNCDQFIAIGELINQHLLLISALAKVESEHFGVYVGILGIICGFRQLHEVTGDETFKKEEDRWRTALERSLTELSSTDRALDVKTWIDITLSYRYLTLESCKESTILYHN